jgi:hypothetical protein
MADTKASRPRPVSAAFGYDNLKDVDVELGLADDDVSFKANPLRDFSTLAKYPIRREVSDPGTYMASEESTSVGKPPLVRQSLSQGRNPRAALPFRIPSLKRDTGNRDRDRDGNPSPTAELYRQTTNSSPTPNNLTSLLGWPFTQLNVTSDSTIGNTTHNVSDLPTQTHAARNSNRLSLAEIRDLINWFKFLDDGHSSGTNPHSSMRNAFNEDGVDVEASGYSQGIAATMQSSAVVSPSVPLDEEDVEGDCKIIVTYSVQFVQDSAEYYGCNRRQLRHPQQAVSSSIMNTPVTPATVANTLLSAPHTPASIYINTPRLTTPTTMTVTPSSRLGGNQPPLSVGLHVDASCAFVVKRGWMLANNSYLPGVIVSDLPDSDTEMYEVEFNLSEISQFRVDSPSLTLSETGTIREQVMRKDIVAVHTRQRSRSLRESICVDRSALMPMAQELITPNDCKLKPERRTDNEDVVRSGQEDDSASCGSSEFSDNNVTVSVIDRTRESIIAPFGRRIYSAVASHSPTRLHSKDVMNLGNPSYDPANVDATPMSNITACLSKNNQADSNSLTDINRFSITLPSALPSRDGKTLHIKRHVSSRALTQANTHTNSHTSTQANGQPSHSREHFTDEADFAVGDLVECRRGFSNDWELAVITQVSRNTVPRTLPPIVETFYCG